MAPQYEERLQKDLNWISDLIRTVGQGIEEALSNSVHAVLHCDRNLAGTTILGDYVVNRQTREIDRLIHAFVARHLPSAGHLRFVSAVLRLSVAMERIGDYTATISRTAVQLSTQPPAVVARDIEMMLEHGRRMLHDSVRSFLGRDANLARATLTAANQFAHLYDKVFSDLAQEGDTHSRPSSDLFGFLATFNRLERVIHQAKNICEETIFVVTGQSKGEKVFQILFVDERNDGASQLAEHFTRKAFPNSGRYRSAGWNAAEEVDRRYADFARQTGLDLAAAWPAPLASLTETLDDFHVVVALGKDAWQHLPRIPFHTTVVNWDLGAQQDPESAYRALAPRIRELMEVLRGEAAN